MSDHETSFGYPPGIEIGYAQITSPVNVGSTTEASGTTIISPGELVFDGYPVVCQFFAPYLNTDLNSAGDKVIVSLFELTTQITRLAVATTLVVSSYSEFTSPGFYRFTPSAGRHTYTVTAFATSTSGTPSVGAGAGGTGGHPPAFIRFSKV